MKYKFFAEEPENTGGGGLDTPLGEKGQKALEAEKQKARELTKKTRELEDKLKAFEGFDLNAIQDAIEFQRTAKLQQAEKERNTEEARKLEREQAASEKKRLQSDKDLADAKVKQAMGLLTETRIDAAIALNLASSGIKPQYTTLLTKDTVFRSQLAYLTRADDGVDVDGVYVVDKSGDPRWHPDDRNKYLPVDAWIESEVIKTYPDMFVARAATGDGLRGGRGKRNGIDFDAVSKMNPVQRAEYARKNGLK